MSTDNVFIGIDPGKKGAICVLIPEPKLIGFFEPEYDQTTFRLLNGFCESYNVRVVMVEQVSSIRGASAGSNFTFGYNTGLVNMLATLLPTSHDLVRPKAWQKKVGVTKKGPAIKKEVAAIAHRLYPDAELYGPRGGLLDGRSDALLIAHYAYLTYK